MCERFAVPLFKTKPCFILSWTDGATVPVWWAQAPWMLDPLVTSAWGFHRFGLWEKKNQTFQIQNKLASTTLDLSFAATLCLIFAGRFFHLMAWLFLPVRTFIERSVPFQVMSNEFNLPEVDSNQGVKKSQQWLRKTGGTWLEFQMLQSDISIFPF